MLRVMMAGILSVVADINSGIWKKNSEIWWRHFVIPKKTKSDTDITEFIRLDRRWLLWKLWAHALRRINMTSAMKAKVKQC